MADLQKTVAIVFDATDLTADNIAAIKKGLDGLNTEAKSSADGVKDLDGALQGASKTAESSKNTWDSMGISLTTLKGVFIALASSVVVQELLEGSENAVKLEKSLNALTGSATATQEALKYIKETANTMGTSVQDVAGAFLKWEAATKGTALEGDKAREIFEAFSGTISKLGGTSSDVEGAMTQLAQGASKGKFELEDLKSIAERVPGFFALMAESINVTTGELFDLISQGEVTGETMYEVARQLKEEFGEIEYIDTFSAAWNRLKNAVAGTGEALGNAGTWDAASAGVDAVTWNLDNLNKALDSMADQGQIGKNWLNGEATFGEYMEAAAGSVINFAKAIVGLRVDYETLKDLDTEKLDIIEKFLISIDDADTVGLQQLKSVLDVMFDQGSIDAETYEMLQDAILSKAQGAWPEVAQGVEKTGQSMEQLIEASKETDKALKGLGLDPDKIGDQTDKILGHFQTLAESAGSSGEQILAGLLVAIDQVDESGLPQLSASLDKAFAEGKISADQYAAGLNAIETALGGVWPSAEKATGAVDKQAKAMKDAEKAALDATKEANNYAIAMAKIEADLAGKVIESKVKLNVAQIEADAKVATAIIDSITQTIGDTQGFISDLAGMLSKSMGSPKDMYLKNLMDDAAKRTKELHDQQMKLVQAQVDYMSAKTSAIANGNSLVTIQADGLQPHLESFMWEILKAIQVKMAYDGGDMLVGGCSL